MTVKGFYNKYQNRILEDDGCYVSKEFRQFAKDLKSALRAEAKKKGINLIKFNTGHYDVSGFFEKENKYIYFSYSEPRWSPIDLDRSDAFNGFLYRTANDLKDFKGGRNNFAGWQDLVGEMDDLFERSV